MDVEKTMVVFHSGIWEKIRKRRGKYLKCEALESQFGSSLVWHSGEVNV